MASATAIACFCVWLQLLLGVLSVEPKMESQFEHCCGLGTNWAGEGFKCETFTGPVAGVATVEQGLCLSAVEICCVRSHHDKQCELGKSEARSGLACVGNDNPGGEYHRDCCEGCKLGILTGSMGQGCAFKKFAFGKPWDPAFLECCYEALPSTTEPFTEAQSNTVYPNTDNESKSTVSPSSDAPSSTSSDALPTPELDDLCELMKGELCSDICIPSPGSYKCACREGFTLLEDEKTCSQNARSDRCQKNNPCQHRCTDTGEAILCSCNPGFVLASDKHSCQVKKAATKSEDEENEPLFKCPEGYKYKASTQVCDDIDECAKNVCPGLCENTIGSYKCISEPEEDHEYNVCPPGYEWVEEEGYCVDIDECVEMPDLCDKETHVCVNTQGNFTCHELTGSGPRSCPAGFKYDTQAGLCKDVDECAERIHGCSEESEECRNTDGAYECDVKCQIGFTYSINLGICSDIDECSKGDPTVCPKPGSKCLNTIGSYECVDGTTAGSSKNCLAGWKLSGNPTEDCIDIDECEENLHSCNIEFENCVNLDGSYRCDPISQILNRSAIFDYGGDDYPRKNGEIRVLLQDTTEDASPSEPTCLPGYQYNYHTKQCKDIDECATNIHNCTGHDVECVNLPATYRCDCKDGFELNITTFRCQDIDECARGLTQCSIGERCVNSIGGHQCAPACPMGLQPHPTIESLCQDIDECELGLHSCPANSHVCVNTNGSYVCDIAPPCRTGYARDQVSGQCLDIDECNQGPGCREHERCVNLPGTYNCEPLCNTGWLFNQQIKNCQDVDECLLGRHNCPEETHSCRNTVGSFVCDPIPPCKNGFRRSEGGTCVDIDECTESVHNCLISRYQYCVNREGTFECITRFPACDRGYEFSLSAQKCQDIDECSSNQNNCNRTRNERCVNIPGSYRCERPPLRRPTQQPACPAGYKYSQQWRRCMDIDECAEGTHTCSGGNQCFNQPGTFTCARAPTPVPNSVFANKCAPGSKFTRFGCEDIDECIEVADACSSNEDCTNTQGSYTCTCKIGFSRDNITQACIDINECQIQQHGCLSSQRCDNTYGSYTCVRYLNCGTGYTLNAASEVCEDDDECALGTHDCQAGYHCRNTPGSYRCDRHPRYSGTTRRYYQIPVTLRPTSITYYTTPVVCPPGFVSNGNGNQCVDEDECQTHGRCSPYQRCVNSVGSYQCVPLVICGAGYKLDENEQRCVDVDECTDGVHDCGPRQTCENRPGGYLCSCPPGHTFGPNKDCVDIDECERFPGQACRQNSRCENTVGSYRCICDPGFENVGDRMCEDVDECKSTPGICQHKCINVWGSYRCACSPGYRLNLDGRSCTDIDECMEFKQNNLCVGICQNTPGSYSCQCPKGYRLGLDQRTCQDIDECVTLNPCTDPAEVCQNTRGHYRCNRIDCPPGYHRDTARTNRCLRTSRYCQSGDLECFRMPSHYSYNFITFVSMLPIPPTGQLDLFTMRASGQSESTVNFHMDLVDVKAPPGVKRATESCFKLRRPAASQALIVLTQSLQGPQDIELRLSMEIYNADLVAGSAVVKLFLFVTEYEF